MPFFKKLLNKTSGGTPYCAAVVAAAGSSVRMGGSDKLFLEIHGIPVIVHTLLALQRCESISEIVVVAREEAVPQVVSLCAEHAVVKATKVLPGGETRLDSVLNGVYAVSKQAKLIAIHDGARPCVDDAVIKSAVQKAARHHAAAPGIPVSSTIKKVKGGLIEETVARVGLVEIQTPQVFNADLIKGALASAKLKSQDITDDCMAAELVGLPVYVTEGSRNNIKLTTSDDVIVAEAILIGRCGRPKD
ncbi:MAG: 2-C-methyl-D-erythritol 4-phosphate cytidylyltransferase [Oscillospiraceae bacterium]|nr:2-C-methyl-D-erythritol 4-phosphate cytidylyltransferase [Oscillospiraceae bacterium]